MRDKIKSYFIIRKLEKEHKELLNKVKEMERLKNEAYNKGLEQGYNEALKEFSKKD